MPDKLIAVTYISPKGASLRIMIPKEVAQKLNVSGSGHIGIYEVDREIVVRKVC
jgi:antitoxin component of MazEF toxin-antitoxin module